MVVLSVLELELSAAIYITPLTVTDIVHEVCSEFDLLSWPKTHTTEARTTNTLIQVCIMTVFSPTARRLELKHKLIAEFSGFQNGE